MKSFSSVKSQVPFPFVLEELISIRPTIKRLFGFTYVYLDEKLLFSLRDSSKQPGSNGMWLFTTAEHVEESWQRVHTIAEAAVVAFRKELLGNTCLAAAGV